MDSRCLSQGWTEIDGRGCCSACCGKLQGCYFSVEEALARKQGASGTAGNWGKSHLIDTYATNPIFMKCWTRASKFIVIFVCLFLHGIMYKRFRTQCLFC